MGMPVNDAVKGMGEDFYKWCYLKVWVRELGKADIVNGMGEEFVN
jgi:hypothetical protein